MEIREEGEERKELLDKRTRIKIWIKKPISKPGKY